MKARPKYLNLEPIIRPKSIAVVGASENPDKIGHIILKNNVDSGFEGKIYPININTTGTIMGYKAYRNIRDVKAKIDLAVIAVPAEAVPQVMDDCGKAGVRGVIVVSGGFAEVGNTELQERLTETALKYSIPVIGPNCLGVTDPRSRVDTLFLPTYKIDKPRIGGVSFAAQSGAVGSSILDMINSEGFGLARFISYGNACVVDEVDILNYLARDKETRVIVFYIEGVKRGKDFVEIARKVNKIKPVVIIKGGMTEEGSKAAHSHTAALAGSTQAYEAVFRQFGFVEAKDIKDLLNFSKIFETQPLTTGKRIAIITNGGGTGVLATDALYNNGLTIAELSEDTKRNLRKVMPPIVNIRLPLDMAGDADDKRFEAALEAMMNDSNVDAIMAIALFQTPGADSRVASALIHYGTMMRKPLVVISMGGSYTKAHKAMMESGGVPVYESPGDAASSLAALINYARYRDSNGEKVG
jgi:acetyl coenzyme A synthetase (ADP forming)-like protein